MQKGLSMSVRFFVLMLSLVLIGTSPAQAQSRSSARVAGGLALVGTGVVMALGSRDCRSDPDYTVFEYGPTGTLVRGVRGSGGPWLWTPCSFSTFAVTAESPAGYDLTDAQMRTISSVWSDTADSVLSRVVRATDYRLLFGGVAVSTFGALLATVWSDTYAEPMFDVQAGPRHLRLSKTFGF